MFEMLDNAISKCESKSEIQSSDAIISTQSTQGMEIPANSIDYCIYRPAVWRKHYVLGAQFPLGGMDRSID